jgi:hypothetical protein
MLPSQCSSALGTYRPDRQLCLGLRAVACSTAFFHDIENSIYQAGPRRRRSRDLLAQQGHGHHKRMRSVVLERLTSSTEALGALERASGSGPRIPRLDHGDGMIGWRRAALVQNLVSRGVSAPLCLGEAHVGAVAMQTPPKTQGPVEASSHCVLLLTALRLHLACVDAASSDFDVYAPASRYRVEL